MVYIWRISFVFERVDAVFCGNTEFLAPACQAFGWSTTTNIGDDMGVWFGICNLAVRSFQGYASWGSMSACDAVVVCASPFDHSRGMWRRFVVHMLTKE